MKLPHSPWEAEENVSTQARGLWLMVGPWDGTGHWKARGMGQNGSGVGMGHEPASQRAQPWLVGRSSIGSLASYLPESSPGPAWLEQNG